MKVWRWNTKNTYGGCLSGVMRLNVEVHVLCFGEGART